MAERKCYEIIHWRPPFDPVNGYGGPVTDDVGDAIDDDHGDIVRDTVPVDEPMRAVEIAQDYKKAGHTVRVHLVSRDDVTDSFLSGRRRCL